MINVRELIIKAHEGDKKAREQLIVNNMGLIWSIVKRFAGRGYEQEDLFQIGSIGLIKAVDKFDVSYDVQFSTYAVPMIAGEIKRFLRDDGMVKVSRSVKETAYKAYLAREQYIAKNAKEPTLSEIAESIGISKEELASAMEATGEVESLHKVIYHGEDSEISLMDKLPDTRDDLEAVNNKIMLENMFAKLDGKERQIIYLRYYQEKTQTQIAQMLGISQVQVSRMEKRILKKMNQSKNA